jgi:hypothetical protein
MITYTELGLLDVLEHLIHPEGRKDYYVTSITNGHTYIADMLFPVEQLSSMVDTIFNIYKAELTQNSVDRIQIFSVNKELLVTLTMKEIPDD